jgi:hypothetical protein
MIRIDAGFFPRGRSNRSESVLPGACWWKSGRRLSQRELDPRSGMLRAISGLLGMPDPPV